MQRERERDPFSKYMDQGPFIWYGTMGSIKLKPEQARLS
jgi:hypothetical protein